MINPSSSAVCVVGAGKVGSNVLRWLASKAIRITGVITPHPAATHGLLTTVRPEVTGTDLTAIPQSTRFLLLCVPDTLIESIADELASGPLDMSDMIVAHTSGLRTSDALSALSGRAAAFGSFHPVQSFPSADIGLGPLRGIGIGLEGDDRFVAEASGVAWKWGWVPFRVAKQRKPVYHAACVFAGNFLTVLAADAQALLGLASTELPDRTILLPMMRHVLERMASHPFEQVLTGPATRGDSEAITSHLEALSAIPGDAATLYALFTKRIRELQSTNDLLNDAVLPLLDGYLPLTDH